MKTLRIWKNCKKVLENTEESSLIYKIQLKFQEIPCANSVKIFQNIIPHNFSEDYLAHGSMFIRKS